MVRRSVKSGFLWAAFLVIGTSAGFTAETSLNSQGGGEDLQKKLRSASLTLAAQEDEAASAQDVFAAARADYARLIGVLYAEGYYGPIIRILVDGREVSAISPLDLPANIARVQIEVTPGPRFVFGTARAAPLPSETSLPEGFASGEIARSDLIRDAAVTAVDAWRDLGHAKAEISKQAITANHANHTLSADLAVAAGPRLRFGQMAFSGKTRVREDRLHEIAGLPKGEVFSPEELQRAADRLRRTGVFRSVALTENTGIGPDNTQDITAEVTDQKRRRMGFGAEISSLEGLGLSALWMHRNLLGGAERLRIEGEIGGIGGDSGGEDYRLSARLDRPATFTPDTSLFLLGEISEEDEPDYFERTGRFGAGLSRIFSDELSGEAAVIYRYSEVDDDLGHRNFSHLTFPVSLTRDRRQSPLDSDRGSYLSVETMPFVGVGDSDSGARLGLDTRLYHPVGSRLVLAGRMQLGSVIGPSARNVPPDLLYFSGGGGTVRGQPYQALAVELEDGDRIGGRSFVGLSAEARVDLNDRFGLVGFFDTGFIGEDSVPGQQGNWHSGAGLGLRYTTGIGPIRLDVAGPVSGDTGDGLQIYIGIGQAF